MSEDTPSEGRWEKDTGDDRISRLARAVTGLLGDHPDGGEDLHGFVTICIDDGESGSGAFGYGSTPGSDLAADFIRFTGQLLAATGIKMTLRFRHPDGTEEEIEPRHYNSPLTQSDEGKPQAELIITGLTPDSRMEKACQVVTDALAGEDLLNQARIIIMLGFDGERSVLMHHGYGEDPHAIVHTLLAALIEADDGSHVVKIPMHGHPN